MKRKFVKIITLMLSFVLLLPYVTACGDDQGTSACTHQTTESRVISDPTCTDAGITHKICTSCGQTAEIISTPAVEHTASDWIVGSNATCLSNGLKYKKCTVCGEILENEIIPQLTEHTPSDWVQP